MRARSRGWSSVVVGVVLFVAASSTAAGPSVPSPAPSPVPSSAPSSAPASAPSSPAVTPPVKPPPPVESRELRLVVAGRAAVVVSTTMLATLTPLASTQAGGKAKQYAVRALLDRFVGPGSRLVAVADHAGNRSVVDAALASAPDVVPVVWTNRRGLFKVGFVDAKGRRLDDTVEYRDVVELQIVAAP